MVDRHEDVTHPNLTDKDPSCDRNVTFYGYVRGSHLKEGQRVHLIGVGDFGMAEVSVLPDPCPIPDKDQKVSLLEHFHIISLEYCNPLTMVLNFS